MKAMLLAAGLGTRMAPLTPALSKPTLPILDEPLILGLARELARQGVESIVVNAHTNAESLLGALSSAPVHVELSPEPVLRGSGGGIAGARALLEGPGPFLVANADMRIRLDMAALLEAHHRSGAEVTLVLRDDARKRTFGTIGYGEKRTVRRITDLADLGGEVGCGLFTGVHVMESTFLDALPAEDNFDIVKDVYVPLLRSGRKLAAWLHDPAALWCPVGSPQELLEANLRALDELGTTETPAHPGLRPPVWIGRDVELPSDVRIGPRAVIGSGAKLPAGVEVVDSLFLPGARPRVTGRLHRAIAFGSKVWTDA